MTPTVRPFPRFAWTVSLAALLSGCAATTAVSPPPAPAAAPAAAVTVADVLTRDPQLSTLNRLLAQAGLLPTLRGPGPVTVFAPTNEAFAAVPAATMARLASDPAALRALLAHHVLPERRTGASGVAGTAKSLDGTDLALSSAGAYLTVDDAVVQRADLPAANGVVHVVDRVLTPPAKR